MIEINENLYKYFTKVGFTDDEIEFLCIGYPELETLSAKQAFTNISILVQAGYPEDDIQTLIAMNPGFLLNEPAELAQKILTLGDDIEESLKNDPSLI
ncbi:MAG: hypothetical protein MJ054_02180 [Clostridia bacterium]|nr:hypothetical protein [Clostridia bacterium]